VDVLVMKQGETVARAWGASGTETTQALTFVNGAEYIILVNGWGQASGSTANYTTYVKVN
jgi:hypothetical protein